MTSAAAQDVLVVENTDGGILTGTSLAASTSGFTITSEGPTAFAARTDFSSFDVVFLKCALALAGRDAAKNNAAFQSMATGGRVSLSAHDALAHRGIAGARQFLQDAITWVGDCDKPGVVATCDFPAYTWDFLPFPGVGASSEGLNVQDQNVTFILPKHPVYAEDYPAYAAFYADEVSAKYVGGHKEPDAAWRGLALMIGHWELKGFGYYAVEERESGAFVGAVGLWQSAGWPELELGYWVVPGHQGKGYALEAARRCLAHARDELRPSSLVSYVAPDNEPSIRLAEKLGAIYEETIELLTHGPHGVYRHF